MRVCHVRFVAPTPSVTTWLFTFGLRLFLRTLKRPESAFGCLFPVLSILLRRLLSLSSRPAMNRPPHPRFQVKCPPRVLHLSSFLWRRQWRCGICLLPWFPRRLVLPSRVLDWISCLLFPPLLPLPPSEFFRLPPTLLSRLMGN
ncbi:hypothetical protein [Pleurotus ostreatus deltaflexivirus 1]|nr:hypothetical protein [Pleurotus ostreatus deltaflexivirus 1]